MSFEIQDITACAFAFEKKYLFTGTSAGNIGFWRDKKYAQHFQAHSGEIILMRRHHKDTLFTAGSEGVVLRWSFSNMLQKNAEIYDLKEHYGKQARYLSINPSINSITLVSDMGEAILTGTKNKPTLIFREVTSKITCAYFSDMYNQLIITTDDSRVIRYDIFTYDMKHVVKFGEKNIHYTSIVGYLSDRRFVCADNKGVLHVLRENLESEIAVAATTFTQIASRINILRLNADEKLLAVASTAMGGKIEIFRFRQEDKTEKLERVVSLNPNFTGRTIALDWDTRSQYIILNSDRSEMAALLQESQKLVKMHEIRDVEWHTYTTMFNFFSSGLHQASDGSSDITAVCTKKGLPFLVAGTKDGSIFVEKNPCVVNSRRKEVRSIHLGPVQQIIISENLEFLVTKSEESVFVWRISPRYERAELALSKPQKSNVRIDTRSKHGLESNQFPDSQARRRSFNQWNRPS